MLPIRLMMTDNRPENLTENAHRKDTVPPLTALTVPPQTSLTVPPQTSLTVPPLTALTVPPQTALTVPPQTALTVPPQTATTLSPSTTLRISPARISFGFAHSSSISRAAFSPSSALYQSGVSSWSTLYFQPDSGDSKSLL